MSSRQRNPQQSDNNNADNKENGKHHKYQVLYVQSLEVLKVRFVVGHGQNEIKSHAICFNVLLL